SQWRSRGGRSRDDRKVRRTLGRQAVQALEQDVLRQLFSAAGQSCSDSEEDRRRSGVGRSDGGGSGGADGREAVAGAATRPNVPHGFLWLPARTVGARRDRSHQTPVLGV